LNLIGGTAFIEEPVIQNSKDDPYNVSDAETMLSYLKSN